MARCTVIASTQSKNKMTNYYFPQTFNTFKLNKYDSMIMTSKVYVVARQLLSLQNL